MSHIFMLSSGIASMNFLIVVRDTSLRCASDPKQTTFVLFARFSMRCVKGILSHATPSHIS